MKKYLELLFLQQIKGLGITKINNKYITELQRFSRFEDFKSYMVNHEGYSEYDVEEACHKAEEIQEIVSQDGEIKIITELDENYPNALMDLGNKKPLVLFAKGNTDLLNQPSVSIIGTRDPSAATSVAGEKYTKVCINNYNQVITSGLAVGCDTIAHRTAIESGGKTIAILPSGFKHITPACNKALARAILESGGCLITEYEPSQSAEKYTYVERDRIVAALSHRTIVLECSMKSGTMKTVEYAYSLNRSISCLLLDDAVGDFSGNMHIIRQYNAKAIKNDNDLKSFFEEANGCYTQMQLF